MAATTPHQRTSRVHRWLAASWPATGLALAAILCSSSAFAQSLETRIDAVTVYPRGANVERSAQVDLRAGSNTLDFAGLPAAIDRSNLRVAAPTAGVSVGQVDMTRVQRKEAFADEVAALQSEIDNVRDRIRALDDASSTAKLQLQFLDGIAQGYAKEAWLQGAQGNVNVASWQEALRVLGSGGDAARKEIRDNDAAKREAQQTLSLLERQLADLQGGQLASTTVTVSVTSNAPQRAELRIEYFQQNASWTPTYEARLNSETGALQLQQGARVQQTTAEPWGDVALQLSTNTPTGRLNAPRQPSEFLDLADDRAVAFGARGPALEEAAVMKARDAQMAADTAAPEVGRHSVTYPVPGWVSIDNTASAAQTFALTTFDAATELTTTVVPRSSDAAFLTARFEYAESLPLFAGPLQVFVDGDYVGRTSLRTALPNTELELPMGQDRRLDVSVTDQGGRKDEQGLIGRKRVVLHDFLFEITSGRSTPTLVEVRDRYPVAVHNDIDVDIPGSATEPTETDVDDQPGHILWRKTLAGGEVWRISHQFEVSYPADRELVTRN